MSDWLKFVLVCLAFGYGLTGLAFAVVYQVALQCKSIDGTTNLAQITPLYVWVLTTFIVGLGATTYQMYHPMFEVDD